jgi:hypothetical protein
MGEAWRGFSKPPAEYDDGIPVRNRRQEVLDKVWQHFVVDGHPRSRDEEGVCMYRDPSGNPCALGLLIPDADYHTDMEGMGPEADELVHSSPEYAETLDACGGRFLFQLQVAHDSADAIDFPIERNLRELAVQYGLKVAA